MTHVLAMINWQAVGTLSGITITALGAIAKYIGNKLDQVGEHLAHQDKRGNRMESRLVRLESTLGLAPLPREDD